MTRGRCGSLLLHRDGLAPSTPCRSPGALRSALTGGASEVASQSAVRRMNDGPFATAYCSRRSLDWIFRFCLDPPIVVGEPCGRVLLFHVSEAAAAIGIGVVGLDLDLLGKIRDRAIIIVIVRV